jgi:ABC-2 type transport system permease protein
MLKRIKAIAFKEIRQLKRDTRMLFVLFAFPVMLLVIFGYAISFDVKNITTAVYDSDKSIESREFTNILASSGYFKMVAVLHDEKQITEYLERHKAQCVIVIPEDFSQRFYSKRETEIQVLIDGINSTSASVIMNYFNMAVAEYSSSLSVEVLAAAGAKQYIPVTFENVFWYNPDLNSTHFLIPGLIAMILIITAVVSISLSIVREKERGTMEQIRVSPIRSFELLIGKTIPYTVIALLIAALILFAGYILFGIVIKGSVILLFFTTLLFLFASLNLGIFISSISDSQQVAFQIATLASLLPSVILSGFIFPIESMPEPIQWLTNITPAKFYLVILRSILLKGAGIQAFWSQVIYLFIFSFAFLLLAAVINKKGEVEQ